MRVLVSGAGGFLGAELLRSAPANQELIGLVRRSPPAWASELPNVSWLAVDLTQPGFQRSLPERLDAVVHLAQSRHDRDLPEHLDDVVEVNVGATARLLDHARIAGARRFVLASTATVYRPSPEPLTESAPLDTTSLYGASKRGAEVLCEAFSASVPCTALRLFTTYGAGQRGRLIAELLARVRDGREVTVEGREGLLLSPIHASDVAAAIAATVADERPGFELLNVGGPERLGLRALVDQIGAALGREPQVTGVDGPEPGGWVADCTRLRERFDLPEPRAFAEGLRQTLERERDAR